MEVYGSYALSWWITPGISKAAKNFAMASAIGALALGMMAQAGAHLLEAKVKADPGWQVPWSITMVVAWVPVVVFGLGAFLRVMTREVTEAAGRGARAARAVARAGPGAGDRAGA